jgi:hypothetical protein
MTDFQDIKAGIKDASQVVLAGSAALAFALSVFGHDGVKEILDAGFVEEAHRRAEIAARLKFGKDWPTSP